MLKVLQIGLLQIVTMGALSGCLGPEPAKDSVLIIGVEHLRHSDVNCSQVAGHSNSAFDLLCSEAFRFHHTWTENTHSLPNLASILAGPSSLQTNWESLSNESMTVAEYAAANGWETGLWVSGPPFLRSSGIGQGFQTFDDQWNPSNYRVSRPLKNVTQSILDWMQARRHFFGVLTVSGLNEPWSETVNEFGESRPQSFDSQIEEVDGRIFDLLKGIKDAGRWDSTLIILVGLSGRSEAHRGLPPTLDLHAENTQVVHFVKPPKGYFEVSQLKNFDKDVALSDWHPTLIEIFGGERYRTSQSLMSFFKSGEQLQETRPLVQVGILKDLQEEIFRVEGLRFEHFFVQQSEQGAKVYNSLVDSDERTLWSEPQDDLLKLARKLVGKSAKPSAYYRKEINSTDLWDRKQLAKNFAKILEQTSGTSSQHLIYYLGIKGMLFADGLVSHPCEIAFKHPLASPAWKTCELPLIEMTKKWVEDPGDPANRIELSRALSHLYFLESSIRVDYYWGRPWNLSARPLEALWVAELMAQRNKSLEDNSWGSRFQELQKIVSRKPVY